MKPNSLAPAARTRIRGRLYFGPGLDPDRSPRAIRDLADHYSQRRLLAFDVRPEAGPIVNGLPSS